MTKARQQSLSGALSVSLGLSSSFNKSPSINLGRSYLGFKQPRSPYSDDLSESNLFTNDSHEQTAELAADDSMFEEEQENFVEDENTALIDPTMAAAYYSYSGVDAEAQTRSREKEPEFKMSDLAPMKLLGCVPSVILGLLLNILDGLSYGMIIFPIGEKLFSNLGSAGLSMFYVSCVISQLVYSLGGSAFKAGIGSEMIEVTPFFHAMAASIAHEIGEDHPDAVISTTITTYAFSSIITGLIFLLLGKFKLGQLVAFFPRHILIGCIGGVGYFLVITGMEVSSKLGSFEYNIPYLSQLFTLSTFFKWFLPVALTVILIILQHVNHNSLILPSYFILVFIITHIIIIVVPTWDLEIARDAGYMFSSGPNADAPWYEFYTLYNFNIVHWNVLLKQIPSMLALTFFGILHVPINVPALAVSTKQDEVDVDRELIAHGLSNMISGGLGSIQNYLVYTNSLLFMRAGADSRVAGVMLAFATFAVLLVGPVVIGFIPVCVVGSLIFLLGYELLKEALWDTVGRVSAVEYVTILVIVLTMGVYDFVIGIVVGVILASFHFLWENTKIPIITNAYTGEVARSTVIRHPLQEQFLHKIGKQIYVLKLQSFLFFGTIGKVEKEIKQLFDGENFRNTPIRYLILDFKSVLNVDFSAAEGLNRIKNFIFDQDAYLIISIGDKDHILRSLKNVGVFDTQDVKLQVFHDLNSSLEWCENEFLSKYRNFQRFKKDTKNLIPKTQLKKPSFSSLPINTPRNVNFLQEAQKTYTQDFENIPKLNDPQPLSLLMFSLQGVSDKPKDFWKKLIPFFKLELISLHSDLQFSTHDSFFILVESGVLNVEYHINGSDDIHETLLPRTILGRFSDSMSQHRLFNSLSAKQESRVWIINKESLGELQKAEPEVYMEMMLVVIKLNEERFENVTGYALIST
jgi:SulP family sulfate permease